MKQKKYLFPFFLMVLVPGTILGLISLFGFSNTLNRKLSDSLFHLLPSHHKFTKDIVIIDIDEQSIAKYADHPELGQWPWKRNIYPTIIGYTKLITPPKITIIDIMFTERSDYDEALVAANLSLGEISHAANFRDGGIVIPRKGDEILSERFNVPLPENSPFPSYENASFPIGEVGITAPMLHVVNVIPDSDGILRRFTPFIRWKNNHFPTLALQAFVSGKPYETEWENGVFTIQKDGIKREVPLGKDGLVRAYFYTEEEIRNIPRYSAAGIIESLNQLNSSEVDDPEKLLVPPTLFEDKIVLIGTSAASTHDDVVTPYGLFPGVIGQAVFASNLIEGHMLKELPEIWGIGFTLFILLIGVLILFVNQWHFLRNIYPILAISMFVGLFYFLYRMDLVLASSPFIIAFPLSYLMGFAYLTYTEGKEKRKFNNVLRNLVDPGVVSEALENMESLKKGGEWEITAFFSDVAGFSSISEELSASDLARLLNEYLSAMTKILKVNSGTLDKYIGDAIVGIFGAPIQNKEHPRLACKTALEMVNELEVLRSVWNEKMDYTKTAREMIFRIGLNCGPAKVGFMGTDSLASYTMMGDTVNLAARLEAAAKDYGTSILVSESIESVCKDEFHFRFLDWIRVKGKEAPVKIYSLVSYVSELRPEVLEAEQKYEEGFRFYSNREWEKAISCFENVSKIYGYKDVASHLLIKRCQALFKNPPAEGWDGVFTRTTK
ncbi:adenylate/guanylate cyclase domain-containing protein [Leptospira congkakensis]|uniref:Adenylate/guanylate cyclase domain-containing protein n=1 Tax=Leptospira congkakensis TaxID=2484932 RepID=A0A4Z1AMH8_9LEPT|nr:adenylate/guanylate cyclase domain-containing protein [Leptospira congkakensis]TGL90720.1 adenylate/guanylate cyclase domain-containing protein [Leptospira congkakensis]TGL91727.1 adenylate/guanylate cyclase domain-containing protein [Leptospira congkakensis]TGL98781.1 adenylate/guanylate cyclase domain-containing protein [Leptospira congkakensis]